MKVERRWIWMGTWSLLAIMIIAVGCYAVRDARLWDIHDMNRPRPPIITPPEKVGQPPSDAIVLFDGTDISKWQNNKGEPAGWEIRNGCLYVVPKSGSIQTKRPFGSCQIHLEWATPEKVDPNSRGQKRSNSGVYIMGKYEVQILDSYENETYADGQAASIYSQYPPLVNASRKPGQWQNYDISFLRPVFDEQGNLVRPARVTVMHNGVVVHNNVEIKGETGHKKKAKYTAHPDKLPLMLQEHKNTLRFRNIWIRELPDQPFLSTGKAAEE